MTRTGSAPNDGPANSATAHKGEQGAEKFRSYHGQPIIKEPVWTWEIPCYLFTGGLAGASAGFAFLTGLRGNEMLSRRAWAASMTGIAISPAFLISDLGRPERFLHMLRMFKVTSPMNVGSWILTASGATVTIATANAYLQVFPRTARLARPVAALLGLPLATYTGALLSDTAIPVWHNARHELPLLFASGAALSAGAAALILTPVEQAAPARRLALTATVLEVIVKKAMETRLGEQGEPYEQPPAHHFSTITHACAAAGSLLIAGRGNRSRLAATTGGTMLLAAALSARWGVFKAGFASVANPKYVVKEQRDRIAAGHGKDAVRTTPHAS